MKSPLLHNLHLLHHMFSMSYCRQYIYIPIVHLFKGTDLNFKDEYLTLKNKYVHEIVQIYKISDNLIITLLKKFFVKNVCIFDCNISKNELYKNEISKYILHNYKEINLVKNKLVNIYIKPSKYIYDNMRDSYYESDVHDHYIIKGHVGYKIVISYTIDCSKFVNCSKFTDY